ncbi:serine/threonine-protein kinase [Microcoleus sp. FACHB-68]|uniref:serine/threonine-protein kinase n=1 Tax=Microcoleus sp. FACHB-68 TaxID=2692826 RepID=UPI001683B56F|nr:serine/threonine-protein kinase [Microcoleus sp. FACHB-68]MBD1937374.1 serine/threonine protein kinase [Microcoleus sp. FACHB-68]
MSNGIPPRYVPTGKEFCGGMGEILICTDTNLDRDVAIKFIQDVTDQRRLFDEIAALQKIRSKNVVQIFDVFVNEGSTRRIGIVQEYIPGEDLMSLTGKETLSKDQYLKVLYQIASGISDIHTQGLIHRDIKPNNMKFDGENILKIFDFGLARFTGKNDSTLGFCGTPGFAAPELYQSGFVSFTKAVDTYAFGVTALYLSGTEIPQSLLKIPPGFTPPPPSFASLSIGIPNRLASMLDLTLSEDPVNRPAMAEVRDLMGKYLLFGKHRALVMKGTHEYILEKVNQIVKLDSPGYGSLRIKYDGLDFLIESVNGAIFVNNKSVFQGQQLPKDCVITIGSSSDGVSRLFITFDISNPEVVL